MKQCGKITEVKEKTAKVLMQRHSSCGSCNGCRMGKKDMKIEIEAINDINAQRGQWVEVDMEEQNVLAAAFIAYVIPLLALVFGVLATTIVLTNMGFRGNVEVYAALMGLVFMLISFVIIKSKENILRSSRKFIPVISEIIEVDEKI